MKQKPELQLIVNANAEGRKPRSKILPLEIDNVDYEINGQRFLKNISLILEPCPVTVILGPNGAGKTLLLRLCHGLLQPTRGTLHWKDDQEALLASSQAMLFQRPVMLKRSLRRNIEYAMGVCRVPRSKRAQRLGLAMESAGLSHLANRPANKLSGGEQQRLALARAWSFEPQVMFLDEPAAHLDPGATRRIEELILRIQGSGTHIVMVTHDLGQARRLASRIIFMYRGRVFEDRPADSFFSNQETEEAKAFVAGELLW